MLPIQDLLQQQVRMDATQVELGAAQQLLQAEILARRNAELQVEELSSKLRTLLQAAPVPALPSTTNVNADADVAAWSQEATTPCAATCRAATHDGSPSALQTPTTASCAPCASSRTNYLGTAVRAANSGVRAASFVRSSVRAAQPLVQASSRAVRAAAHRAAAHRANNAGFLVGRSLGEGVRGAGQRVLKWVLGLFRAVVRHVLWPAAVAVARAPTAAFRLVALVSKRWVLAFLRLLWRAVAQLGLRG